MYCFKNRMMLPHKNGSSGLSTLKIIEVLRRLRNKDNIYELLDSEYHNLENNILDPMKQPININVSTRL